MSAAVNNTNNNIEISLALIVAMADNRTIGRDNKLPWYLPDDLKYFKSVTMGKPIVMGRKTFDSIGKPLPGRLNIVVTRNANWQHFGVKTVASLQQAISCALQQEKTAEWRQEQVSEQLLEQLPASQKQEVMVIGGEEIYREALGLADRLYITRVQAQIEGDAFFPKYDETNWREVNRQEPKLLGEIPYFFQVLERIKL